MGFRKKAHDALVRSGITWKRGKPKYRIAPVNENLDTIFNHYNSFHWNIPTISPEWIATFPGYDAFVKYCKREKRMWAFMTKGSSKGFFEVEAYYLRWVDFIGHNDWKSLRKVYNEIFDFIWNLKSKRDDIIVLSDHGCKNGLHTNHAYLGSDVLINAVSVHELRSQFESLLDGPLE
jgi:hypothetical protein